MDLTDLDDFTQGYIECALWLADDNPGPGEWTPHPPYVLDNIDADDVQRMIADCYQFRATTSGDFEVIDQRGIRYSPRQAGEDFWFTRNRYGLTFLDSVPKEPAERLTLEAESYGDSSLYLGDDGKLYLA